MSLSVVLSALALGALMVGTAKADGAWIDELSNSLSFYKTAYPASNWDPYTDKLSRVRDGVSRDDQQIVKVEMGELLKMLRARAHGIHDVAAGELYNFALTLTPMDQEHSVNTTELGIGQERPMSVPAHVINTPYDGGPHCQEDGCDYWIDDVFDAGAG